MSPSGRPEGAADAAFIARSERFDVVGSTNDIVRTWLSDGTPEVALAVAAEQTEGRGRHGRVWIAPPGAALLLSLGFRPAYLEPERVWRLGAIVALAMVDAAEEVAGLREGMLRLKWPNDVVAEMPDGSIRKLAGVLGETEALGTPEVRAVIGIGINADWSRADFPADFADSMTSLSELSGGRPIESSALLEAFLLRLEPRLIALRERRFDVAGWHDRQVTTGHVVCLQLADGVAQISRAVGVDGVTGALLVEDRRNPSGEREILAGEVTRVKLGSGTTTCDTSNGSTGTDTDARRSGRRKTDRSTKTTDPAGPDVTGRDAPAPGASGPDAAGARKKAEGRRADAGPTERSPDKV